MEPQSSSEILRRPAPDVRFLTAICERNIAPGKQAVCPFGVAQKSQQHMRGLDCLATERAQLVASKEEDSTRTLTIAIEHRYRSYRQDT